MYLFRLPYPRTQNGHVMPNGPRWLCLCILIRLLGGKVAQPPRAIHTAMPRTTIFLYQTPMYLRHDLERRIHRFTGDIPFSCDMLTDGQHLLPRLLLQHRVSDGN
jgi:hypothetical protein